MRVSEIADAPETVQEELVPASALPDGSMPAARWRQLVRTVFSFPAMLGALVAGTVFIIAHNGLSDPDIWWHLRNAEYLFATHSLPSVDMYSFTVSGHPWINHEWLAEVPYYLAWRAFGLVGIKVVSILIWSSFFLDCFTFAGEAVIMSKRRRSPAVAVFLGTVSFGPRTILFGYIYMVTLLMLLERYRCRRRVLCG